MESYLDICPDYDPRDGSKTCRNWQKHDICRRADRVLCSVALTRRPAPQANRAREDVRRIHEYLGHTEDPRPGCHPYTQRDISRAKECYRAHVGSQDPPWREAPSAPASGSGVLGSPPASQPVPDPRLPLSASRNAYTRPRGTQTEPQPLVEHPELLTMESVDQLASLGLEACLETRAGEVWLVPSYTDRDRQEISYQDARTLVIVMQAFPGSALTHFARSGDFEKIESGG